ncbi:MAG: TRAP transporter large permease [Bacillota bacterium]
METTVAIWILIGGFLLLLVLRVPVAFAMIASSVATAWYMDLPIAVLAQRMVSGINSFSLLAIPFFILAGEIMGAGGISRRLIDLSNVLVGRVRGGLAIVNVAASMFFGGISGSSVADTSSIGSVLIPMMKEKGYDTDYAVGVTISSSAQGILVPPSHNMIIYSLAAGSTVSVAAMFAGGLLPGVFLGLALMVTSYVIAVRRNYPREAAVPWSQAWRTIREAVVGLLTAVIIMVGVLTGIFTATESSAVAVVYALAIAIFFYREMTWAKFVQSLLNSLRTLAIVVALIAASSAFGWLLALLKVPALVTDTLLGLSSSPYVVMLVVNIVLLLLGMIMDMAPLILITTPILLPVATGIGMDPVHFGIVMMLNLSIGLLTPPVGSTLFVGSAIGNISIERAAKGTIPFYVTMFVVLMIITYFPATFMWVPRLMLGY